MASNRSKSKVLQNAQKAFRYSAVPVVKDKMPYATGTVKSVVEVSKDLRDWTIRNNPFRAVNGNRDPLIRQIANVAVRSVKDAKRDLLSGDLTFRRLNKTVMDFVGGGDPMDDLDFNFDFDFGDGTFSDSGSDDQTSNANFAIADNLSRDFAETQMHATSAMIGTVEHATNKINKTTMAMTDSAVTRLITSNMTIAARSSAQLGTISAGIETVNKNISLLVEQGNAVTGFISQAQRYMETSEQNLNDIKALLTEMVRPAKKKGYSPEEAPEFMQGRFDIKKYAEYIFNDSALGPVLSSVVGTTFKSLKLELPSFIDDMWAQPLSELNPLKTAIEKLLPAVGRLSNLDKMVDRVFQSFMAKLDNGEYGGFLNGLGLYGFGFKNTYNKRFYGSNYEKGTVTWNGKSERALQEVIPSYLANIEGYLKDIAIHTSADTKYQLDKKNVRHYNYDSGEFQTFAEIQARAMRDMNDAVQSSFAGTTEMLEKMVETNEESRKEFSELLQNIMSAENADITSKKEWKEAVYNAVSKYRLNDDIIEANIDQLLQQIIDDRGSAIIAMNNLRSAAGRRDNYLYHVGNEITYDKNGNPIGINKYSPTLVYDSADKLKEAKRDRMTAEERRRAEMEDAQKEKQKGFKDQAVAKLKSSEFGAGLYNAYELFKKKGGPINQSIDFINAQLQGALVRLVHRLPSYDVGSDNIASNQVATVHKGEIVVRKEIADKIRAGQFDDSVASWFKEVSGIVPDFNNQNMREAVGTLIGGKNQRGKVQGAVLDSTKEYYRVAIDADAIEDGDILQVAKAILENQANQTAIMAQQADKEAAKENDNKRNELTIKMLGERGEDGLYHGTMMSQYANMGLDIVNAFKHALYGDEYTTSQGVKVEKTDDHVLNTITGGMKKAGDVALSTVFGQDYKDKAAFKTAARFHNDLKSGLTATYNGDRLDESQYVRGTYAEDMARRRASASGVSTEEQRATEEALKETSQKALEINKNLVGTAKGALLGGLSFSAMGILGDGGIIPSLLTPGGPLGGAIIGAGISILSRNNDFMNFMFGEEKDGERIGGLISKDMQERWKGLGSKLLGPAVLGAGAGFLFPNLVNLADGAVGSILFGTGPIAGAALGVGASIIMRSKAVQDVLYGEEGKGGTTGLIGKMKTSMKDFWDKNKGQAKGMGLGAIGGALLAGTAGGGIGAILLSSAIGAGIGMKTGSDKFNEFLFGTKKFERDSNGRMVYVGRDGDGFVGKLSRMVSVNVLHPIEAYVRSASRDFAEWLRYDIGYQIKSIFEPFTTPVAEGMSAVAESLHNLTSKITKFIGKLTAPFRKILKGLLKLSGRAMVGTLKTGMTIAGQVVSAPLKMAGGIGRFITGKYDPEVGKHNKQFWRGYTDEDGTRHHSFLNPLARFKDAKGAFQRTESGFFDAVGNAARELNPFLAYGDARGRYAREHGLEDNSGFMGGFFGAAGKQHRDQVRENRRQTKQEQRLLKLSRKWAKDDKYNDKLVLSERELNRRNDKLRKILGPDYKDKSNADMMEFIYRDTFGEKAAKQEKLDDATVKTAEFLGDIKNITQGIFDYITGKIADAGDAVSNAVSSTTGGGSSRPKNTEAPTTDGKSVPLDDIKAAIKEKFGTQKACAESLGISYNKLNAYLNGRGKLSDEELEALGNAIDIPLGRKKTVGEKIGQFGKKIGGLFSEKNKVGKFFDLQAAKMAGSEYTVEGGKIVKSFNADAKHAIRDYDEYTAAERAEKQKTKEEKQADKDAKKLEKAAQKDIARTERKNAKEKRKAERAEIADARSKKIWGAIGNFFYTGSSSEALGDDLMADKIASAEEAAALEKLRTMPRTSKKRHKKWFGRGEEIDDSILDIKSEHEQSEAAAAEREAANKAKEDKAKAKAEKKKKKRGKLFDFGRKEPDGDPEAMDLISEHEQSEAAYKARKAAKTAKDRKKEKPPVKVAIAGIMDKGKILGSSIFKGLGTLFGSKGALVGIGAVAIGAGLTFLLTKFPDVIEGIKNIASGIKDWFVDTAWPVIKGFASQVGTAIMKIMDAVASEGESWYFNDVTGEYYTKAERDAMNNTSINMTGTTVDVNMTALRDSSKFASAIGAQQNAPISESQAILSLILKEGVLGALENGGNTISYEDAYNRVMAMDDKKARTYYNDLTVLQFGAAARNVDGKYQPGFRLPEYGTHWTVDTHLKEWIEKYHDSALESRYAAYFNGSTGDFYHPDYRLTNESIGSGHFMQNDPRWANNRYANAGRGRFSTMANGGCGPTALANAAMSQGIRTNPLTVARLSRNGGYAVGGGTSAGLFTNGARRLGLRSSPIGAGSIKRAIASGNSVVFAGKGNGLYTRAGHILSARGLDGRGNVIVDDPMRRNSLSVPLSTIGRGMTHAWSIGRGEDDTISSSTLTPEETYMNSMREMTDKDTIHAIGADPYEKVRYYYQKDAKWETKPLVYFPNDYIGDSGCVISALGSVLATLTGLNYRPDFITEKIIGTSGLTNVLNIYKHMLPPSVSAVYQPVRLQMAGRWDKYTTGRYSNQGMNDGIVVITSPGAPFPGYYSESGAGRLIQATDEHGNVIDDKYIYSTSNSDKYEGELTTIASLSGATKYGKMFTYGLNAPFVIYGGHNYTHGNSSSLWTRGTHAYSQHAKLVIPVADPNMTNYTGTNVYPNDRLYNVFDVGSQHVTNSQMLTYSQLFDKNNGVESVFMLVPHANRGFASSPRAFGIGAEPTTEDIEWMIGKFNKESNPTADDTTSIQDILDGTVSRTLYGESIDGLEDTGSDNLLAKITKALGELGSIALGAIGRIFGGKGDIPTMSTYNTNNGVYMPTDNGNGSGPVNNTTTTQSFALPVIEDDYGNVYYNITPERLTQLLSTGKISQDRYVELLAEMGTGRVGKSHSGLSSATILSRIHSKYPNYIIPSLSTLPSWAVESAGESKETYLLKAPSSSKLRKSDIDNIVAASLTLSAYREGGFNGIANYFGKENSYVDNDRYPAFGIDGFNGHYGHAQEVLRRMIKSGEMSPEDVEIAEHLITQCGITHDASNPFEADKLRALMKKYPKISQYAQAGYATQLMYSSTADVIKGYENGDLQSIEEMILMNHLSPYGSTFVKAMLGLDADAYVESGKVALSNIRNKTFSNNSLTNLVKAINDYHSNVRVNYNGSTSWGSWHRETLGDAYRSLGGTDIIGFGGGISDSFNSGSYDIVDTPVAIGRTPRVEVDSAPVTTRLDVIINYLRQIANTARQNRAETAATNLDIGHGAIVEKRSMSGSSSNNMPATPVYTDIKNSDRMKAIHDRIARSPRPV